MCHRNAVRCYSSSFSVCLCNIPSELACRPSLSLSLTLMLTLMVALCF